MPIKDVSGPGRDPIRTQIADHVPHPIFELRREFLLDAPFTMALALDVDVM
jgi:hypothetical protein